MIRLALSAALLMPGAALAQAPAPTATTAPVGGLDPARLAASRMLIDQIMPPASREKMIEQLVGPMMENINRVVARDQNIARLTGKNPRVQAAVSQFMQRQASRTRATLRAGLPAMSEAIDRAYARRFDLQQLRELSAFFATPTGRAYLEAAPALMSDPDLLAWQSGLMTKSMATIQDDVAGLTNEVLAASEDKK